MNFIYENKYVILITLINIKFVGTNFKMYDLRKVNFFLNKVNRFTILINEIQGGNLEIILNNKYTVLKQKNKK